MWKINAIDQRTIGAEFWRLVTLTYPAEGVPSPKVAKKQLQVVWKRFEREWGPRGAFWKMEPQRRGAPHFHLLICMGVGNVEAEIEWWARTWYEVVASGDLKHLQWHRGRLGHGNRPCVEVVRSWGGVASYASKYICKQASPAEHPEWLFPGRWWGMWRKELLPMRELVADVEAEAASLLKRTLRRYFEHLPTNRCRVELDGRIHRIPVTKQNWGWLRDRGARMRPYQRRLPRKVRANPNCGVSVMMTDQVVERLMRWASSEAASKRFVLDATTTIVVDAATGELLSVPPPEGDRGAVALV